MGRQRILWVVCVFTADTVDVDGPTLAEIKLEPWLPDGSPEDPASRGLRFWSAPKSAALRTKRIDEILKVRGHKGTAVSTLSEALDLEFQRKSRGTAAIKLAKKAFTLRRLALGKDRVTREDYLS